MKHRRYATYLLPLLGSINYWWHWYHAVSSKQCKPNSKNISIGNLYNGLRPLAQFFWQKLMIFQNNIGHKSFENDTGNNYTRHLVCDMSLRLYLWQMHMSWCSPWRLTCVVVCSSETERALPYQAGTATDHCPIETKYSFTQVIFTPVLHTLTALRRSFSLWLVSLDWINLNNAALAAAYKVKEGTH